MEDNADMNASLSWRVLLVGGASGVGKTVAAQVLARRLGVSTLLVDDVCMAIQRVTTPDQRPELFYFLQPAVWQQPLEELLAGFIGVAQALTPALEAIIAHHVGVSSVDPIILEGDGIFPALAATSVLHQLLFSNNSMPLGENMRAVYVDEPDEAELLSHMLERGRGFDASPSDEQRRIAHVCWRYGQWLTSEAVTRGVPVVSARPFASLPDRLLAAANRDAKS
jgi:2-phosphoglycerate kinase